MMQDVLSLRQARDCYSPPRSFAHKACTRVLSVEPARAGANTGCRLSPRVKTGRSLKRAFLPSLARGSCVRWANRLARTSAAARRACHASSGFAAVSPFLECIRVPRIALLYLGIAKNKKPVASLALLRLPDCWPLVPPCDTTKTRRSRMSAWYQNFHSARYCTECRKLTSPKLRHRLRVPEPAARKGQRGGGGQCRCAGTSVSQPHRSAERTTCTLNKYDLVQLQSA